MRPDKKPKGEPRQTREQARAEYDKKTKGLIFTKDFQTRQEAVMRDTVTPVGERVMAWILRRSWGEYVLYAIRDDGEPAYQRDCCRELKLDKKRVSIAVAHYQRRGYLEDRPKLLYPVISPAPTTLKKVTDSPDFLQFMEEWKVTYSLDFEEEKVLDSRIKKIRKVRLSLYKKWRKERKSAEASLLETGESNSETGQRAAVSPFEASNQRHKQAPAQSPVEGGVQGKGQNPAEVGKLSKREASDYLFSQIEHMQECYPKSPFSKPRIDPNDSGDRGLVNRILAELGDVGGEWNEHHLIGYLLHVAAQFKGWGMGGSRKAPRAPDTPGGPKSLGLLVNWAKDYARIAGKGGR